jgi:short-subunit dehydrogenase
MTRDQKVALAAASIGAGVVVRLMLKRPKLREMAGSVVLITDGSRGLGLAMAREFAEEGCRIVICARDRRELDKARDHLERDGAEVLALECDVTQRTAVESMIREATAHYGRIDVLVNNAGVIEVGPVENMTTEDFEVAMDVMFWGVVHPTLAILPQMLERAAGRIVNITSIGGKVSLSHLLPYNCAKFAAVGFSEGLRAELLGKGVLVTTVAPGLMRTGSYLNAKVKGRKEQEAAWFSLAASLPLLSMGAEKAARKIVEATKRGEAEQILTTPAKVLAQVHAAAPGKTADLLSLAARLLLPPSGRDKKSSLARRVMRLRLPWMKLAMLLGRLAARRLVQPEASRA